MITYKQAKEMKELGLTQKRHDHSRYYINETTIAYFEDIKNAFDTTDWHKTRKEEPVDWMNNFSYIPELVDLIGTETYNLTLDAAVYHFMEAKISHRGETVDRTVQAMPELKIGEIKVEKSEPKIDIAGGLKPDYLEAMKKIK